MWSYASDEETTHPHIAHSSTLALYIDSGMSSMFTFIEPIRNIDTGTLYSDAGIPMSFEQRDLVNPKASGRWLIFCRHLTFCTCAQRKRSLVHWLVPNSALHQTTTYNLPPHMYLGLWKLDYFDLFQTVLTYGCEFPNNWIYTIILRQSQWE